MADVYAFVSVAISFVAAFVTAIPIIWYRTLKTLIAQTSGLTETGQFVSAKVPTIDSADFERTLKRQRKFAIMGLVALAVAIALAAYGFST